MIPNTEVLSEKNSLIVVSERTRRDDRHVDEDVEPNLLTVQLRDKDMIKRIKKSPASH